MTKTHWSVALDALYHLATYLPFTGVDSPIAGTLLVQPIGRRILTAENERLDASVNQAVREHETGEATVPDLLVIRGHFTTGGQGQTLRPSRSKNRYWIFGAGAYGSDGRGVAVVTPYVEEGSTGPEVSLHCHVRVDEELIDTTAFPVFPNTSPGKGLLVKRAFERAIAPDWFSLATGIDTLVSEGFVRDMTLELATSDSIETGPDAEAGARIAHLITNLFPGVSPVPIETPDSLSGHSIELPAPRLIKTPRDAEFYAADFMRALGFTGVEATPVGPDGGIDVIANEAVAQVKLEGRASSRQQLQQLSGVAHVRGIDALFFSLSGYTEAALGWANETGMALFEFAYDGSIEPRTTPARDLLEVGLI